MEKHSHHRMHQHHGNSLGNEKREKAVRLQAKIIYRMK
jgi:hypothetical protein